MKPFRERNPITVGLVSVAIIVVLMTFAFSLNRFTFLRGVYSIEADFADAAGLTSENEVRAAGLKIGKVLSVELSPADDKGVSDRVRVKMEIQNSVKLGSRSEAEIKLKTLLGNKFVEVVPRGRTPFIRDDRRIPVERTRIPFEIYEVTNVGVEKIGAIDAKALNDALNELADLTEDPDGNLGRALDGLGKATDGIKDQEGALEDLVTNGGELLETLGSRSAALGRIFENGAALLNALSSRRDSLARFVDGSNRLATQVSDLIKDQRGNLDPILEDLHDALLIVKKQIGPVEDAVESLGPSARSFANVFRQGHWGDVWLQTLLGVPLPPLLPGGTAGTASTAASADADAPKALALDSIFMGVVR